MTSRCVHFLDIVVIRERLSHNSNQEVQKMDHEEEDGSNPQNVKNWFLSGFSKTISSNVKLSQRDLESMWDTSNHIGVVDSLVFEIINRYTIKFQLVQSQLVKTDRERQSKDAEDDNEPENILEDKEDNSYDTCNLVNNLHEVQRFWADNERQETDGLSLGGYRNNLVLLIEPVWIRGNQTYRNDEV